MHAKDAPRGDRSSLGLSGPEDRTSEKIDALRRWGLTHPLVLELMATLPPSDELEPSELALTWEAQPVPGVIVDGIRRISVLRLRSRTPDGPLLVGQVQALLAEDDPVAEPELALYRHRPQHASTQRAHDPDAWFVRLLDHHYERAHEPTPMAPAVLPEPRQRSR